MMQLPSDLLIVTSNFIMPAANVDSLQTLLAAPGAGMRYRLWTWGVTMRHNEPAGRMHRIRAHDGATDLGEIVIFTGVGPAGSLMSQQHEIPGGYAYPVNTALQAIGIVNVAGARCSVWMFYTIEAV